MFFSYCFTDFSARWRGHETGGVSRCTDYSGYWHTRFDLFRWFGWLKKEQETMHKTRNYAMRVALRWWYLHLISPGSDGWCLKQRIPFSNFPHIAHTHSRATLFTHRDHLGNSWTTENRYQWFQLSFQCKGFNEWGKVMYGALVRFKFRVHY